MSSNHKLVGYAIVSWDNEAMSQVAWQTGDSIVPSSLLPSFVSDCLARKLNNMDTEKALNDEG